MLELVYWVLFFIGFLNIVIDILLTVKFNSKKEKEWYSFSENEVSDFVNGIRRSVWMSVLILLLSSYFFLKYFL